MRRRVSAAQDVKFSGGMSEADVERKAFKHGHSTPQVAGRLANHINAQHLVLTHFSPRYSGDQGIYSRSIMSKISALAEREFNAERQRRDRRSVTAALDLMQFRVRIDGSIEVSKPEREKEPTAADAEAASQRWVKEVAQEGAEARGGMEAAAEEAVKEEAADVAAKEAAAKEAGR